MTSNDRATASQCLIDFIRDNPASLWRLTEDAKQDIGRADPSRELRVGEPKLETDIVHAASQVPAAFKKWTVAKHDPLHFRNQPGSLDNHVRSLQMDKTSKEENLCSLGRIIWLF